jgi:gluconolactonase
VYIADTGISHKIGGERHIRVFPVTADGKGLGPGKVFAEVSPGCADGLRIDSKGNIWTSAGDGVHCFDPNGVLLGKIKVPESVSNVAFGGPKRNRLFITGTTSLYAVYVGATGAQVP